VKRIDRNYSNLHANSETKDTDAAISTTGEKQSNQQLDNKIPIFNGTLEVS
jgi:hypothetical protein